MRTWVLVVVGAVLPLLLGASLGSLSTSSGKDTWAYPMPPGAFLALSIGLAVSHLLVLLGYLHVARGTAGTAATFVRVGAIGSALVALCEIWSGLLARTDLDAGVISTLQAGYAVSSVLIAIGSAVGGYLLTREDSPYGWPLLVNGLFLVAASLVRFLGSDGLGIAALTVWSLLYVWLGVAIRRSERAASPSAAPVPA